MFDTIIRYVKSRSDQQLRSTASEDETSNCKPEAVTKNNSAIVPCGLIAWSLFNDTYGFSVKNKVLDVSKRNIAWKSDQEQKFGSDVYPKNFQSGSLIGGAKLNASIPVICLSLLPSLLHLSMFLPPSTSPRPSFPFLLNYALLYVLKKQFLLVLHVTVERPRGSYCLDANCSTANFQKTVWEDRDRP
jgi:hypothetical protein